MAVCECRCSNWFCAAQLLEIEEQTIPNGLHVVGQAPEMQERAELLYAYQKAADGYTPTLEEVQNLIANDGCKKTGDQDENEEPSWQQNLLEMNTHLCADNELSALVHALDTGYTQAAPGGDVLLETKIRCLLAEIFMVSTV